MAATTRGCPSSSVQLSAGSRRQERKYSQSTLSCQVGSETDTACGVAEGIVAPSGDGGGAVMTIPISTRTEGDQQEKECIFCFLTRTKMFKLPATLRLVLTPSPRLVRYASAIPKRLAPTPSTQLKDEFIPFKLLQLVDPVTNVLRAPASLSSILASLDRSQFSLLLVDPAHDPPIVKIIDKKAEYTKIQQKKQATKAAAVAVANGTSTAKLKAPSGPPREVQLTWGVSAHDLGHKLGKAKELLDKGNRVSVIISNKKGAEVLGAQARAGVIDNVKKAMEGHGLLIKSPENKGAQVILEFKRLDKS